MNSKHPKTQQPTDMDLKRNPGVGTSKGTIRDRDARPDGENTIEGDVGNDTTSAGGVDPRQRGRQNK